MGAKWPLVAMVKTGRWETTQGHKKAVTKADLVVPKIDEALKMEENAVARWPAECMPRRVVCSVIKEAQWAQQ